MDEIQKYAEELRSMARYVKGCGDDFVSMSKKLDEAADLYSNPFKMFMSSNLEKDTKKIFTEFNLLATMVACKLEVLGKYLEKYNKEEK